MTRSWSFTNTLNRLRGIALTQARNAVTTSRRKACIRPPWTSPRRAAGVLAVLTAVVWLSGAGAASAEVTAQGSFSTSVAIEAPPFHGIEPQVVLSHDSANGNGLVGVGWRLEAGSYITRAGRTAERHGSTRPIAS